MGIHLAPAASVHTRAFPGVLRFWRSMGSGPFLITGLAHHAAAQTCQAGR
jgi:hypothetical protein